MFRGNIGVNEAIRKIVRLGLNQAEAEIMRQREQELEESLKQQLLEEGIDLWTK